MPRNITITFADGSTHVYQNAPDDVTPEQVSARAQQEFGKEVTGLDGGRKAGGLKEVAKVTDKAVRGGLAALPGFIGDTVLSGIKNIHEGTDLIKDVPAGSTLPGMTLFRLIAEAGKAEPVQNTKFGDVTKNIETIAGILPPKSQPETSAGKAAGNVGEAVVGTAAGGGVGTFGQKVAMGLASGGGAELAARFFGDNAFSRGIGALVGGGAAGLAQANKPNAQTIVQDATEHMTPADWRRAKVLEATLDKEQIPHLKSQVLGPRSTLDDTVAVAATHPKVRPKLTSKVENASDAARRSYDRFAARNLPIALDERPTVIHDVQGAAESAIRHLHEKANKAFVAKMPPVGAYTSEESVLKLHKELTALANSPRFGPTSAGGAAILRVADDLLESKASPLNGAAINNLGVPTPGKPITNIHQINNLLKDLNTKSLQDGYKGLPLADVKAILKRFTPEFNEARAARTSVMHNEVNPAQRGLTGQLAQMGGGTRPDKATAKETALALVFPHDRLQPQAIVDLSKNIGGEGVGHLLREHLARNMEKAASMKSSMGEQIQGPYKFVESVAGTNAQRQNLEAALTVTAKANGVNPGTVKNGFYKLMRAFETTKDLKLPDSVDRAALSQQAGKTLPGFMVAPNSRLGRAFWEKATAKTYDRIAEMVLSKDGLAQLEAIARSPKPEIARSVAISIIAATGSGEELPE